MSLARVELKRRCELGQLRKDLAALERAHHRRPDVAGPLAASSSSREATTSSRPETIATGFAELDETLGGGFAIGGLNEVLFSSDGCGALEAFAPALARANPGARARFRAWIQPARLACLPYPPALAQAGFDLARLLLVRPTDAREQAWAVDLALRSGACDVVIARLDGAAIWSDSRSLRRLQLAAEEGDALGFFVRPAGAARAPSPAAVRLAAAPLPSPDPRRRRMSVHVLHCRAKGHGVLPGAPLVLEWSRDPLDEPPARAAAEEATAGRLPPALALGA